MKREMSNSIKSRLRFGGMTMKVVFTQMLLVCCLLTSIASGLSQNRISSLVLENVTLSQALKHLGQEGNCKFIFNYDDLSRHHVSVNITGKNVQECLDIILKDKPFKYDFQNDFIVISYKEQTKSPEKYQVTGSVRDEQGNSLPGVAIIIKGVNTGTATDINGGFVLPIPQEKVTLVFSFIGMKNQEIVVTNGQQLNVKMVVENKALEEVVVTGFQTISRERSSGAAVIVGQKELGLVSTRNVSENLEGVVPGLMNYNGQMSIRGISSFAVNSSPLIVIDGMPVENITSGTALDGQVSQGLANVNPEDIESVTVLKDAASTSLYGVRASNGVIVITTKRAKAEKVDINFSANYYFKPISSRSYMHQASTSDILDYEVEYMVNDPNYISNPLTYFENLNHANNVGNPTSAVERIYYSLAKGEINGSQVNEQLNQLRKNDYRKEYEDAILRTSFTQDYNLSLSKGGEKSNLFFSIRYAGDQYVRKDHSGDKLSMYLKNALDLTPWLKFTYGANINYENQTYSGSPYLSGTMPMPYETLYNNDGSSKQQYFINYEKAQQINNTPGLKFMGYNPLDDLDQSHTKSTGLYLRMFTHADVKLAKGLNLGVKFQYEDIVSDMESYSKEESYLMRYTVNRFATPSNNGRFVYNIPEGGYLNDVYRRYKNINFRTQMDYQVNFQEKHDLTVLGGVEIRQNEARGKSNERYGYDEQSLNSKDKIDWEALGNGVMGSIYSVSQRTNLVSPVYDATHRYFSFYANAGYSYDSRYSITGSVRVEQADLFGTDPKYRYRPLWSVGGAWNLHSEEFMKDTDWLNLLKVRASYGITGNVDQTSSPFLIGVSTISMLTQSPIIDIMTPPNKLLRWEKTSALNVGIDFSLFDGLNGSLDVYRRYSSDLLANKQFDPSMGFPEGRVNNGEMSNKGVELSVGYTWLRRNDWTISTQVTAAYNSNEIEKTSFLPTDASNVLSDPYSNYYTGKPHGAIYGYKYQGLTENGNPSVMNELGEVVSEVRVTDPKALTYIGQLSPKWNGSVGLNASYKGIELYARFVYYTGHSLRNDVTPLYGGIDGGNPGGMHKDLAKRWTPENSTGNIPSMNVYGATMDRNNLWRYADTHERSAAFIKLRNIGLSYVFPKELLSSCGIKEVRLRAQVDNPWYWAANNEDIDPESFSANSGKRSDKQMPTYSVGLSVNF